MKHSIIIPVKNAINYLPKCIHSIVSQNYSDYELIISDDHSEDGTNEYLKKVNNPHIKIIQPEKRLATADHFNFAIQHATGEWIMTLGANKY
jgi:glycosyltransferase involved in cell wall biosynthesis